MFALLLLSVMAPICAGILSYCLPYRKKTNRILTFAALSVSAVCNAVLAIAGIRGDVTVLTVTPDIRFYNRVDNMGLFFAGLFCVAFLLVAVFALSYFEKDNRKNKFDCFFLLSFGALMALCYAGNLLTMYIAFEMVTLFSMPLVLHDKTKESIDAALKYLLYSVGGAFLGFIGVVYLSMQCTTDAFAFGGILSADAAAKQGFGLIMLLTLIGFGAKCGMFPLHNWLPTAHPVAPAPASSLLSGIITKSGIVAVIRIVYYTVGTENLRGTWMHKAWIILILTTVLLGSFMAVVQKNFKKRLAFSTVSQVSYVLLGLAVFNTEGLTGAFMQAASHAVIKICLFLVAGIMIHVLGLHDVDELEGVGKKMPITTWCYTICSLGLVGVPPTSGFVAKWYLATGALDSGLGAIAVIAPIVLIISAILTAYYLLSVTIKAFFPSDKTVTYERVREPIAMVVPLIILAVLTVVMGIWAEPFAAFTASLL